MVAIIDELKQDHRAMAALLVQLQRKAQNAQTPEHLNSLRVLLDEIVAFSDGIHHYMEEQVMNCLLSTEHAEDYKSVLYHMIEDHQILDDLAELVYAQIDRGDRLGFRAALIRSADRFVKHHLQHADNEQKKLFFYAERHLTDEQWHALDIKKAAFLAGNFSESA
ncbi:Uncharacterised protein [BD1-7 clade bacterium]|uniref:Hemerythrin-like domain-containing protein n=1 Tax=BD1-7 clade bacterium TaxID=2029982 RepID=A0A5S9QX02_9GAMM|nr:Uncharacterised protein [BD1-7 clade bacterium]